MNNNWQLPEVFIAQYRAACKLAATSDKAFANFRQDPHIACVIENTNKEWADKALDKMGYTPTMVRYWYTHRLITELIGYPVDIVEIGAGYGGMRKVWDDIGYSDRVTYHIFDIPEAIELQKRFLGNISTSFYTKPEDINHPADLCISWCAWSELSRELREEYAEKVISKCSGFFICSNYNKEEDREILARYFPDIKEYSDELVQNVLYA